MHKTALTKREIEILNLISQENTSGQISKLLGIRIRTVETHRKNLLIKTQSNLVIGLFKFAIREGWAPGHYVSSKA